MPLHDPARHRQTETRSRQIILQTDGASKWLKYVWHFALSDSQPLVGYVKDDLVSRGFDSEADVAAVWRILNRVAQKVVQHLLNAKRITLKRYHLSVTGSSGRFKLT
jgi:hypothetical protein